MDDTSQTAALFEQAYSRRPHVVANAGGRVNIIGEHTDYHEGFVFPAAIDLRTWAAAAPRSDGILRVRSQNENAGVSCAISQLAPPESVDWRAYVLGPFWALRESGVELMGADILIRGDVPFGGGLSSSASVGVAMVGLGAAFAGAALEGPEVARIARLAENRYCHVPCGIMDQMASACGKTGHALLLDCRTLEIEYAPINEDWALVVADSRVKHSVGAGEYAKRQAQCASGLAKIRQKHPGVKAARDVSIGMLEEMKPALDDLEYRRLLHAVTENARCLSARDALLHGDAARMGALLYASHESLAKDYEVSCDELDTLVEIASGCPGIIGARLTGAGFGGNTVNLVHAAKAAGFCEMLQEGYLARTGKATVTRIVSASGGLLLKTL
ncbi:MAG: galactokinase [Myxococcota bacterium]|jgi:galactokinase